MVCHQEPNELIFPKRKKAMVFENSVIILCLLLAATLLFLISTTSFQSILPSPTTIPFNEIINSSRLHQPRRTSRPQHVITTNPRLIRNPKWYDVIAGEKDLMMMMIRKKVIKVGLVNTAEISLEGGGRQNLMDIVKVEFDRVPESLKWAQIFPEWIDEGRSGSGCPEIPMPDFSRYGDLDIVVASMPIISTNNSSSSRQGIRDVFRLQMNLVVANLVVESGGGGARPAYVVFLGEPEPMWEIFRCEDLLWKEPGEFMIYKPDIEKLMHKVSMPIGGCDLARPMTNSSSSYLSSGSKESPTIKRREAFVTILHSSQHYVCGAIALAQSILMTNTTKDLVLLADATISNHSIQGLESAGWKIKRIERIHSPNAEPDAYNEWNYSKLRIWQLTEYDKLIFIDSDFIILNNIDHFFAYPELSASANDGWLFNSGIMILEPSTCFFNNVLMPNRFLLDSYNGGDQGFLNEVLTWWHRLTIKLNHLKFYTENDKIRAPSNETFAVHYLGMKPWLCYRDYDCNWDNKLMQMYASDDAHQKWWRVYDSMPVDLHSYCGLNTGMISRMRKWRGRARKANFDDRHWQIKVKDPRRHHVINAS